MRELFETGIVDIDTTTSFLKHPASPSQLNQAMQPSALKKIRTMGRSFLLSSWPMRTISGVLESFHRALSIRRIISPIG